MGSGLLRTIFISTKSTIFTDFIHEIFKISPGRDTFLYIGFIQNGALYWVSYLVYLYLGAASYVVPRREINHSSFLGRKHAVHIERHFA